MPRIAKKTDKPTGNPTGVRLAPERWTELLTFVVTSGGNISRACEKAKITRMAVYNKRDADPVFAEQLAIAQERGVDVLEDEATRRAFEGTEEPVGFHQGVSYETKTVYSDALIQFLLKGRRPERYRDRVENVDTRANGPSRFAKLTAEELEEELKRRLG